MPNSWSQSFKNEAKEGKRENIKRRKETNYIGEIKKNKKEI